MSFSSPFIRIATGLGVASFAFIAGFSVSSAYSAPKAEPPIVNVNAWSETAPQLPAAVRLTSAPADRCNPWDISDVAMEEVLREMTRRGWRPPNQGDAVQAMQEFGVTGISVDDPDARMPRSGGGDSSFIAVLSASDAARASTEGVTWPESAPQAIADATQPATSGVTVVAPPLARAVSAD